LVSAQFRPGTGGVANPKSGAPEDYAPGPDRTAPVQDISLLPTPRWLHEPFHGEAEDFRQPGEPRRVIVTRDLLDVLGVADRPRLYQQRVVREWLVGNEPHQLLALSLRQDGFMEPRDMGGDG
jgi:hypothetical protein